MKSIFEEMGGIYRQEGDYLIPNIKLPEQEEYQLGKYGRMRRNFLKEHTIHVAVTRSLMSVLPTWIMYGSSEKRMVDIRFILTENILC